MNNYKKYANEILDDVELYKLILKGEVKTFPRGFWTKPYSLESAAVITRYLLEEKLKLKKEDIPKVVTNNTFSGNKLGSILKIFNGSTNEIINNAYPNTYLKWEFKCVPKNFWEDKNNTIAFVKWLVDEKIKPKNKEDLIRNYNYETLVKYGGESVYRNYGIHGSLELVYPGITKSWQLAKVEPSFWEDSNNVISVVKWLVEDELKLKTKEDIIKKFTRETLKKYNISTLQHIGLYHALDLTYPNTFKPWDFKVPNSYWKDKSNIRVAIRWFIEDKLKLRTKEEILNTSISIELHKHGFGALVIEWTPFELLDMAYPGKFKKEEFKYNKSFRH